MSSSADQIRNGPIVITIPPNLAMTVRRPDMLTQFTHDILPLEIYGKVIEELTAIVGGHTPDDVDSSLEHLKKYDELLDRWACLAAVAPRVVLTDAEVDAEPQALCVQDLSFETRLAIFRATRRTLLTKGVRDAVAAFRRQRPEGADAGPSGPAVRPATVDAPRHSRSRARA